MQDTVVPALAEQSTPASAIVDDDADTKVAPPSNSSVMMTLSATDGPSLMTARVNVAFWPATSGDVHSLSIRTSASAARSTSALEELFVAFGSSGYETSAVLSIVGVAAPLGTLPEMLMTALPPAAIEVEVVHDTLFVTAGQPSPVIAVTTSGGGTTSVTV